MSRGHSWGQQQTRRKEKERRNNIVIAPVSIYLVEYLKTDDDKTEISKSLIRTSPKHYSQAVDCPIVARGELRDPSHPGSTVHMEIDISNHMDTCKYQTADNLGMLPKNNIFHR